MGKIIKSKEQWLQELGADVYAVARERVLSVPLAARYINTLRLASIRVFVVVSPCLSL